MYRRGAKRWNKKFYHLKGHNFLARRFNRVGFSRITYEHDETKRICVSFNPMSYVFELFSELSVYVIIMSPVLFVGRMQCVLTVRIEYGGWDNRATSAMLANCLSISGALPPSTFAAVRPLLPMKSYDRGP